MTEIFFSLCVFFLFLLFYPTISFALMNLLSAQLSHQNILKEREKRNSCQRKFIVFIFTFGCLVSVSLFISGFVIFLASLYNTVHTYKLYFEPHCSNARCSYTFILPFGTTGDAWCLIQLELPSQIRKTAFFVTYVCICYLFFKF